jgi:hypothetical protein
MADPINDLVEGLLEAQKGMHGLYSEIGDLEKQYKILNQAHQIHFKSLKLGTDGLKVIMTARRNHKAAMKDELRGLIEKNKELKKEQEEQRKLNQIIEVSTRGIKGHIVSMSGAANSMKSASSSVMGLVSAFGVQGMSLNSIVKTSLTYNKSLFDLTRTQNVAGKGMGGLSKALSYVGKSTKMSQIQFLELSNSMLKGFIGIKPGMEKIAKVMGIWGDQMGYDYESAKVLFALQQQFPPLFDKMVSGLEKISEIDSGKNIEANKALLKVTRDQVTAYGLLNDISSDTMDEMIKAITPLTQSEKEYNELLSQRAGLSQKVGDLEVKFAKTFEPLQKSLLKTATDIIDVMGKYPSVTEGIMGAVGAIGLLAGGLTLATTIAGAFATTMTVATGGLVLVGAAIAAATIGTAKWLNDTREQEDATKKIVLQQQTEAKIQKDLIGLSQRQKIEYNKIMESGKKENETIEDKQKRQIESLSIVTKEGIETRLLVKEWEVASKKAEGFQKGIDATTGSIKATADATR